MILSLFIIYTKQLLPMYDFYESLGLNFTQEKHGDGPEHFSCSITDGLVLEIYPIKNDATEHATKPYRFEFFCETIDELVKNLIKKGWQNNMSFRDNRRGTLFLVDPDGNDVVIRPR